MIVNDVKIFKNKLENAVIQTDIFYNSIRNYIFVDLRNYIFSNFHLQDVNTIHNFYINRFGNDYELPNCNIRMKYDDYFSPYIEIFIEFFDQYNGSKYDWALAMNKLDNYVINYNKSKIKFNIIVQYGIINHYSSVSELLICEYNYWICDKILENKEI